MFELRTHSVYYKASCYFLYGIMLFEFFIYVINAYIYETNSVLLLILSLLKLTGSVLFCILHYKDKIRCSSEFFMDAIYLLFSLSIVFTIFINRNIVGVAGDGFVNALDYHKTYMINLYFYYFLGKSLYAGDLDIIKKMSQLVYIVMVFLMIFSFDIENFVLVSVVGDELFKGSYLRIGDLFAIVSFIMFINASKVRYIYILVVISTIILYFIGSRTSLYCFILSTMGVFIFYRGVLINNAYLILCLFYSFLIFMVVTALVNTNIIITLQESRMLAIFTGLDNDYSSIARNALLYQGLEDIYNNPLFGSFAGQLNHYGDDQGTRWGGYIHNILSFWRQFGFFSFISIVTLYLFACTNLWINRFVVKEPFFVTGLLLFCIVEILFARSYLTAYIFLALGVASVMGIGKGKDIV